MHRLDADGKVIGKVDPSMSLEHMIAAAQKAAVAAARMGKDSEGSSKQQRSMSTSVCCIHVLFVLFADFFIFSNYSICVGVF